MTTISSDWSATTVAQQPSARITRALRSVAVAAGVGMVWFAVATAALVSPLILPPPAAVVAATWTLLVDGEVAVDAAATLGRVGAALTLGIAMGTPVGLAFGYSARLYAYFEMPLHALRSVPATALFPLLLVMVGVGEGAMLALATYPCFLLMVVNVATGARLANGRRLAHARALGLGPWALVWDVLWYEALPSVFQGIRTAVSFALALIVAVEMFIGVTGNGLGRTIYEYQSTYRMPEAYAAILITGCCGVLANALLTCVERRMLHWLPNQA